MRKIFDAFILALILVPILVPISLALDTVSLPSSMDARVELADPNKNFGDSVNLNVRSDASNDMRSFLYFNLSSLPLNAEIKEAWFMLFMKDAPGVSRTYEVQQANAAWIEGNGGSDNNPAGELTWNNQPGVAGSVATNNTGTTNNVWLSWNVTDHVMMMHNGSANYGWRAKDMDENSTVGREAIFNSREASNMSLIPKLVVTYVNKTVVLPAMVDCRPNPLSIGSQIEWINCFIEMNEGGVNDINMSTISLAVVNKSDVSYPDLSFSHIGDYDLDSIEDLQIRFNREEMDEKYFTDIMGEETFTFLLNVSGGISPSLLFDGMTNFTVIKPPEKLFGKYMVNSTSASKGVINKIPHLDLNDFNHKKTGLDGYFFSLGDPKYAGMTRVVITGQVDVEKIVMKGGEEMVLIKKQLVIVTVVMDNYDDCSARNSKIYCEGSGWIMISNKKTGEAPMRHNLDKMVVAVNGKKASIQGGDFWNDVFSVTDIPIKNKKIV